MKKMMSIIGIGAALLATPALAQTPPPSAVSISGSITTGGRQVDNDTNSSKLTEYRDLRETAFLSRLTFDLFHHDSGGFFEFLGSNVSLNDQSLAFRGGQATAWALSLDWTDVPHDLSNKAQTPYIGRQPGLLAVPASVPITFKKLNTAAADAPGVRASDDLIAAYQRAFLAPTDLGTQTRIGRFAIGSSALEAFNFAVAYDRRTKSGLKPAFGPIGDRPPRTLNIQLTEPVDYRTQDVTISAGHVGRRFQVEASYLFSDFANRVDTLVWENVYTTAAPDAIYDAWDRAVSTFGRRPLPPDNRYHNASVSLGADLPGGNRLNGTFAYGRLEQNEELLPYSYNAAILTNPALPRRTAQAEIGTTQLFVDYVVNPADRLNVRAWARYYGLDNNTPEANWQYVTSDTSNLNGTASFKNKRINLGYASDRTNGGIDATYRTRAWRSSLTLGYERESVAREHREADTDENRLTAAFRARPARWANLRARYMFGDRDGGTYNSLVNRESYWYALADAGSDADNPRFAFSNHPDMRRFDVSDRRRHQADVTLTLTPRDVFSLATSVRYRNDDFESGVTPSRPLAGTGVGEQDAVSPGSQLGRLDDTRLRYALDAFYMANDRVSLNAFVNYDKGSSLQRGLEFNENNKQNPSTVATAELGPWTRASSQWTADSDDRTWTTGLGGTFTLVPNRAILSTTYTVSLGDADIAYAGFGVTNFNGTPFPANHQFAFNSPPTIAIDWHTLDVRVEIPLVQGVVFLVGYNYERYRLDDWQQETSQPWVEAVGSEFLLRDTSRSHQWGNRLFNLGSVLAPAYNAHIGWAAFSYRF